MKIRTLPGGVLYQLSHAEAFQLVMSLLEQIRSKNPNTGRIDLSTESGGVVSFAAMPEKTPDRLPLMRCSEEHSVEGQCILILGHPGPHAWSTGSSQNAGWEYPAIQKG